MERSAASGRPQLRVGAGLLATFCLGYTCGDTWELGYHGCLCAGDTAEEAAAGAGVEQEAASGGHGAVSVGGHGRTLLVMVLLTVWMWGSSL